MSLYAQNSGTSGNPFTSLADARTVTVAGIYYFNLNGNTFSTYVDNIGYVQVAIDFGNGVGSLPQSTSLTNTTRGILSPTVLATLTEANAIRMKHSGGLLDVISGESTLLSRITSNTTLHQGTGDNGINNFWSGAGSTFLTNDAGCATANPTGLHQTVAHLCGNGAGMHWIPVNNNQGLDSGSDIGNTESITLWVRAAVNLNQACDNLGTSSNPFSKLGYARNVTAAGIYYFNLNGTTFSTYVDTNGFVQVAIDFGNGTGNLPQSTSLTNTTRGLLSAAALAELTDATTIKMLHSGGLLNVTSTNSALLSRITSSTSLHRGNSDNGINDSWTGTGSSFLTTDAICPTANPTGLHQTVAHVCGNGSGMHWNPVDSDQALSVNGGNIGNTESITLWVQANAVAIDSDCDGVINNIDLDSDNDGITDADECQEIVILSVSGNFYDQDNTTTVLSQDINKVNPYGLGNTLSIESLLASDGFPSAGSDRLIVTIKYAGVTYASFQTSDAAASATQSINYSNGASGSLSLLPYAGTGVSTSSWDLYFPSNIPNSGTLEITIDLSDKDGNPGDSVDDIGIGNITMVTCQDKDNDGVPNFLDLDSDNDGCPDSLESGVPTGLLSSGVNSIDGVIDSTENAIINNTLDTHGSNGFAQSLEDNDTFSATGSNSFVTTNYNTYALNNTKSGCGTAMITQVYRDDTTSNRWIEITNIAADGVVVPYGIQTILFKNGDTSTSVASGNNDSEIAAGASLLFEFGGGNITNTSGPKIAHSTLTNFNENDIISLSRSKETASTLPWETRLDVVESIQDATSLVRIDETLMPNTTFTSSEWVTFVDDALNPYRDLASGGPQRHPHDPLLSEIINANTDANNHLGLHRINGTTRTSNAWDNGIPDRSRLVMIDQNYEHNSSTLKARKLDIQGSNNLTITNQLLVVTNNTTINSGAAIRIAGTGQFIQTHTGTQDISGDGSLLIDQDSEIESIFRYNYMSSPVNTFGQTHYTVADVLKDGTTPTSANSTPLDINFIGGYDGSATSPISLAEHWIYTFASADGTTDAFGANSNWEQKLSDGIIPQTNGFIFKGPGIAQNYTFVGTPKDGELTTIVGSSESYLVGNPYASAISAKKFIEDNINSIDGTLYFWEHVGEEDTSSSSSSGHNYGGYIGGYATRNISMGLAANQVSSNDNSNTNTPSLGNGSYKAPGSYIPIAQGFFISGDMDGGTIVFNNSQREHILEGSESLFYRTTHRVGTDNVLPIMKLGMSYSANNMDMDMHRQIGISFNSNNSFDYDAGYDSKIYDLNDTDIYWKFENNDDKYIIAGVQEITHDLEIPLVIVMAYDGEITITLDEWQNINRDVYFADKLTGASYKINNSEAVITLSPGEYTDRFVLSFNSETLSIEVPELDKSILTFYDTITGQIVIQNKSTIAISKVKLYNILGQEIQNWKVLNDSEQEIRLLKNKTIKNNIYIIKINTEKGEISRKIILQH